MVEQSFVSSVHEKNSKALWYVLAGVVVVAIILGGGVWWYANNMLGGTSSKPAPTPVVKRTLPSPSPSAAAAAINLVAESKSITFPKAGRVQLYFIFFNTDPTKDPYVIDLVTSTENISVQAPASAPTSGKMHIIDTGLDVAANEVVAIQPYDFGDFSKPSTGWLKPANTTTCGSPTHLRSEPDIFNWMRTTINATGEPIVSEQCWTDMDPGTDVDYNDFLMVFTYKKVSASSSPSPSPSASTVSSPSPSPSAAATSTPTPSPTVSPTPSPSSITNRVSPTPSPTARAATVDTSGGVPVTGVVEDTIKAIGIGVGMLVLGLLML